MQGARARAWYRSMSYTIGTPFWLDWDRAKHIQKPCNMHILQHAHFMLFGLGNARQTCLMLRSHQYLQPQTLPTACIFSVLLRFIVHLKRPVAPPGANIMSIMGPVWAPTFLLDTTHMRLQDPSKTLGLLRWQKVRNEGPIVLMMLA